MTRDTSMLERLRAHAVIGGLPEAELEWLIEHGELHRFAPGEVITRRAQPAVNLMYVMLTGRTALYVERGRGRRRVAEWHGGEITGMLPYSRLTRSPGEVRAEEPTEAWAVSREHFPEMINECPNLTETLVHVMTDRARAFTSTDLRDEKTMALGKLAAGLAHELNNPASAVVRSAKALEEPLAQIEAAARALSAHGLTQAQFASIDAAREACLATPQRAWSPLEQADREDAIADWLDRHGADPTLALPLAETAATLEALDGLAASLEGDALAAALRWAAAGCMIRYLTHEIDRSAVRIFEMVSAIKGFTHMDRSMEAESVDVGEGLQNAIAVLRAKAATKSVSVTAQVDTDLPTVHGVAAELNQIWANLIDNAIDAVPEGGLVEVTARRVGTRVLVEIVDAGSGIPTEIRGRIFDPFFTTKEVGDAVGLGLDVVRRSLERHDGEIDVESRPGRTVFRVRLPAEGLRSSGRWSRSTTRIQIEE